MLPYNEIEVPASDEWNSLPIPSKRDFTEKALAEARAFSMSMGDGKTVPFGALQQM